MGFLSRFRQGVGVYFPQPQPEPNYQEQISGPPPGPGLLPSRFPQLARGGLPDAPLSITDPFNGPGRHSEQVLARESATPLNAFLGQLTPDSFTAHYRHAHRITTFPTHYYPKSPWWPDRYAPFQAADAYTSLRPYIKGYAPAQLQRSAGGLQVAAIQTMQSNMNTQLAKLYIGSGAPTSANQSGKCR